MSVLPSILLIDDSQAIRELAAAYCAGRFQLKAVDSEDAALKALREDPYDLILLDIELEDTDGYTVIRHIYHELDDAGLPRPPVLAMSAHDGSEFLTDLMECGFSGRIKKPFKKGYFLDILRRRFYPETENSEGWLLPSEDD